MGTRADFYVGRGKDAEWLGSIAWDGYPDGLPFNLKSAKTEEAFRKQVEIFFTGREDVATPEMGWPWPWNDSGTTDYAYAFDGTGVFGSCFGHDWFDVLLPEPDDGTSIKPAEFPDMTEKEVTMRLYKTVNLKDKDAMVQFVGVYALKWRPEWGEPEVGFVEVESARELLAEADLEADAEAIKKEDLEDGLLSE